MESFDRFIKPDDLEQVFSAFDNQAIVDVPDFNFAAFDIHPNNDYLLVTSTKGRIYVFRIDTGELRGSIKIPLNSTGF